MGLRSGSGIAAIVGTLGLVLLVTTAVLPNRTTADDIKATGTAVSNIERASIGG